MTCPGEVTVGNDLSRRGGRCCAVFRKVLSHILLNQIHVRPLLCLSFFVHGLKFCHCDIGCCGWYWGSPWNRSRVNLAQHLYGLLCWRGYGNHQFAERVKNFDTRIVTFIVAQYTNSRRKNFLSICLLITFGISIHRLERPPDNS